MPSKYQSVNSYIPGDGHYQQSLIKEQSEASVYINQSNKHAFLRKSIDFVGIPLDGKANKID